VTGSAVPTATDGLHSDTAATADRTRRDPVDADPVPSAGAEHGPVAPQVLVVDNDPGIRLVFARALARVGYEVFLAASGVDALHQIDRQPDLVAVLSDLNMPRMGGQALAQQIHRRQPGLPILFVSSSPHAAQLANHPSLDVLTKPVTADQLIAGLEALLTRLHHRAHAASAPS